MQQYRITIEQLDDDVNQSLPPIITERLRVTVDASGELDHAAILTAVKKTKRIYRPRKPKAVA